MTPRRTDVLIIGGGFAGAATAFHLSQSFAGSITLVEREKIPGAHASGRNAALFRQSEADPEMRRAAAASRAFYREHRREVGFEEVGSLLLGSRGQLERLRESDRVESEWLRPREALERVPLLDGHSFEAALFTPGDGVIDTWALLNVYLDGARGRGVEVLCDLGVEAIAGGPPWRVTTSRGEIEAGVVVDAAGAWAAEIAVLAGLPSPALVPWKRHLFVLDQAGEIDPGWPFVWSLERELYFRPESGGLLFSICDEERSAVLEETVSPGIEETLAEVVLRELPSLAGAEVRRVWSCFRTKAADGRFVIGRDPRQESFVWVASLGGHGMGCSWEIGRLAAAAIRGEAPRPALGPQRFSRQ